MHKAYAMVRSPRGIETLIDHVDNKLGDTAVAECDGDRVSGVGRGNQSAVSVDTLTVKLGRSVSFDKEQGIWPH